jgi:preprotein translocase subunit YajC
MFITPAFAEAVTDTTVQAADAPSFFITIAPLILVFFIFYIFVIRPQNKRLLEHRKMVNELKKGDKVITGGGVFGTVKKLVGDDQLVLEIAPDVEITVLRHTLMSLNADKK